MGLAGYEVEPASAIYERACGRVSLFSLHPRQLIYSSALGTAAPLSFYRVVTNGLITGICLIVTIPAMLLTALILRVTTRGPVWHSEPLRGLNSQVFRAYRFQVNGAGVIAKCMRRFRLEELAQFLNVLKGELAMVGPRAARPEYEEAIERYIPFYRERSTVRPGVTGWAQVHLDRTPEFEDTTTSLEYDLYYVKNRSLGLDSLILLHAIKSLLVHRRCRVTPGSPAGDAASPIFIRRSPARRAKAVYQTGGYAPFYASVRRGVSSGIEALSRGPACRAG